MDTSSLGRGVYGKYLDLVQMLLADNRISVNQVDGEGRTVLSLVEAGNNEIAKYFISLAQLRANEPDNNDRTTLSWAAGGEAPSTQLRHLNKNGDRTH